MTNVAPRGVPAVPWVSEFPELNVRTYVTVAGRPGVYFFSLDAGNPLAVGAARTLFHLPYYTADMKAEIEGNRVEYYSLRRSEPVASFEGQYEPTGPDARATPGSLDEFLTERYCLYALDSAFVLHSLDIHHPPWPLQPAVAVFAKNTMAEAAGLRLPEIAPLVHFAKRQDVVAWRMKRI
jgi:uncharacterized protein YqjF (DUF2071 family)